MCDQHTFPQPLLPNHSLYQGRIIDLAMLVQRECDGLPYNSNAISATSDDWANVAIVAACNYQFDPNTDPIDPYVIVKMGCQNWFSDSNDVTDGGCAGAS